MSKQDEDYYHDQLGKLEQSEYGFQIQILDGKGNKTNFLKLNKTSAKKLIEFFFNSEL